MDKARTRILRIKSEVLDTIQYDRLPILKYQCIIAINNTSRSHDVISKIACEWC